MRGLREASTKLFVQATSAGSGAEDASRERSFLLAEYQLGGMGDEAEAEVGTF